MGSLATDRPLAGSGMRSCLYQCYVMHARRAPIAHRFVYSVVYFYLDLAELPLLRERLRLLGIERRGLFSFFSRDHLDGSGCVRERISSFLQAQGLAPGDYAQISLLTLCRQWGYVFNPVSFYFCSSEAGEFRALVAEVNNTFGERHCYFLGGRQVQVRGKHWSATVPKVMHVSPFARHEGAMYRFLWRRPDERFLMCIRELEDGVAMVDAALWGRRIELTDGALLRMALASPWLTLKVTAAIHWQALKLYLKGLRVFSQPPPSEAQQRQAEWWRRI